MISSLLARCPAGISVSQLKQQVPPSSVFFPFLLFPSTETQSKLDFRTFFCVKAQEGHDFKGLFLRRTAGAFWTPFQKENKHYPSPGCSSEVMTQWKGNNKLRFPRGIRPKADNNEYLFYRILSKYFLSFNCHCYGVSIILYSEFRLLRSSNSTWRDVMPVIIVQIVFLCTDKLNIFQHLVV